MVCNNWSELIAAAGDVDAPVAVPIVAALVVTAAVTFAVPAYLNSGQKAADQIFSAKERNPLDNKKTSAQKTSAAGKTKRR
jgi:mannitol-specific phosphotransferase system IIBC component